MIIAEPTNPMLTSDSSPDDWSMHRGSAIRSGATTANQGLPGEVIWTFNTQPIQTVGDDESSFLDDEEIPNSPLFATPAVVDGIVYLPTGDRRIVALDATTGNLIWEHVDDLQHHDFNRCPNGNTVYLAWELIPT